MRQLRGDRSRKSALTTLFLARVFAFFPVMAAKQGNRTDVDLLGDCPRQTRLGSAKTSKRSAPLLRIAARKPTEPRGFAAET